MRTTTGCGRVGRRLAAMLALALLVVVPVAAGAQEVDDPRAVSDRVAELERRFVRRVSEALSLDEDGRHRLARTLEDTRAERRRAAERRAAVRRELADLVAAPHPDEARVAKLLDEWAGLQLREAEIFRQEQRRLAEFLSPVQRARFVYLRQRFAQAAAGAERDRRRRPGARPEGRRRPTAAQERAPVRHPESRPGPRDR
ncbi:MAG: hypothetical protein ACE5JR_10135 [Gemmatimonadota bacterium]